MRMRKKIGLSAVFMVVACLLVACAQSRLKMEPIPTSENPAKVVDQLGKDLEQARQNQLDVLSPTWFTKAATSHEKAKKGIAGGHEISKILKSVAYGRAQLEQAKEAGKLARTALPEVIEARDRARTAGAADFERRYAEAEKKFLDLTRAIEKDDLRWAQRNKDKVIGAFDRLELMAIKKNAIGEAQQIMQEAREQELWEIAPRAYQVAQVKYNEVDGFIAKNRYKDKEIREKAGEALFYARRLMQVVSQSKKIRRMQPEQITLWIEGMLHNPTRKLSAPDLRDQPFKEQVGNILSAIDDLQQERQSMAETIENQTAKIAHMQKEIASLEGLSREERVEKERLAAEKRFRQLYNEIRRQFGPTEAEVYKEGDRLVIRLKAIQFPSGKAVIMPKNYTLLSRVQQAIRTFGQPEVVIEGHTDSVGSDEVNERLSKQRAEAVREYFVANGTLPYEKIFAVGYGSKRPLASNVTEEGRAINRRIDILITPQKESMR